MHRILRILAALQLGVMVPTAADVLIVADEFPAMRVVAGRLQNDLRLDATIVAQTNLPSNLAPFRAVIVYIHGNLAEPAEMAFIHYTTNGGKLVALHHSISSGKRKNQQWFSFLGISLPAGDVSRGGYKWIEPAPLTVVNLAPDHYITTNRIAYPQPILYRAAEPNASERAYPGVTFEDSEVYLNHVLTEPRTLLLGLKYADPETQEVYRQDRAGWIRQAGKGWIVYLMPGHSVKEFENPVYGQMVVNAVGWRP